MASPAARRPASESRNTAFRRTPAISDIGIEIRDAEDLRQRTDGRVLAKGLCGDASRLKDLLEAAGLDDVAAAGALTCTLSGGDENDWDAGDAYRLEVGDPLALLRVLVDFRRHGKQMTLSGVKELRAALASVIVASVSSSTLATETAFSSPTRTTFVGSMIPASIYCPPIVCLQ